MFEAWLLKSARDGLEPLFIAGKGYPESGDSGLYLLIEEEPYGFYEDELLISVLSGLQLPFRNQLASVVRKIPLILGRQAPSRWLWRKSISEKISNGTKFWIRIWLASR
jgi:hypothetical protein